MKKANQVLLVGLSYAFRSLETKKRWYHLQIILGTYVNLI